MGTLDKENWISQYNILIILSLFSTNVCWNPVSKTEILGFKFFWSKTGQKFCITVFLIKESNFAYSNFQAKYGYPGTPFHISAINTLQNIFIELNNQNIFILLLNNIQSAWIGFGLNCSYFIFL